VHDPPTRQASCLSQMLRPRGVSRKAGTAAMRLGRRVGLSLTVVSSARVRGGSGHRPAASGVDALICRRRLSGAAILFAVTRAWNRALKRPCDATRWWDQKPWASACGSHAASARRHAGGLDQRRRSSPGRASAFVWNGHRHIPPTRCGHRSATPTQVCLYSATGAARLRPISNRFGLAAF
jgi:hypothetical protein